MKIQTELKVDSAHRLLNYNGKCANVHGHTWRIVVSADTDLLDESGFVVDFTKIKEVVMKLDHSYICNKNDDVGILLLEKGLSVVRLEDNPTAELLSEYLAYKVRELGIVYPKCKEGCKCGADNSMTGKNRFNSVTIKVYESEVSFAEITI